MNSDGDRRADSRRRYLGALVGPVLREPKPPDNVWVLRDAVSRA